MVPPLPLPLLLPLPLPLPLPLLLLPPDVHAVLLQPYVGYGSVLLLQPPLNVSSEVDADVAYQGLLAS
jgi:hypothetical protein